MSHDVSLETGGRKGPIFLCVFSWGLNISEGISFSLGEIAQGLNLTVEMDTLKRFKSCLESYRDFFFPLLETGSFWIAEAMQLGL